LPIIDELQKLWGVQLLDIDIMSLERRLQNLDRGESLKARLDSLIRKHNEKSEEIKSKEIILKELELELTSIEEKIKKDEERLYKTISTQKELDSLNQELEYLSKERTAIEDKTLDIMEALDPLRNELPKILEEINEVKTSLNDTLEKANEMEKELSDVLGEKESIRKEKIKGIDQQILVRYETLRKAKRGRGLAKVVDGRCSECGVDLSLSLIEESKSTEKLLTCEHCGRIIFSS